MSHVTLVQTKPGEFEFRMPDIGEGVMEGEIVKWLVAEGDVIAEDQPIVEIMTDKATVEIPCPQGGTLLKRLWEEGQSCPVGAGLILIAAEGASASAAPEAPAAAAAPVVAVAASAPAAPAAAANGGPEMRKLAAPATRKLAREMGVELGAVAGTGPHGRVTQEDVRAAASGAATVSVAAAPAAAPAAGARPAMPAYQPIVATGEVERIPLRGLRRKIAEKMVQSAYTAPHVTTFDEVDMTALVALRARLKAKAEAQGIKLSYMPFIMKAVMAAFQKFPIFNASVDETTQEIVIKKYVHMGFAAATDNGLMVPVIKNAHQKSLFALASSIVDLAERTRDGKAASDELSGSSFTVSNVGSIGGLFATPIINYPEVAILGVNKIEKRAVVRGGEVVVRDMMYLGLSFDHRIIDGSDAVQFLNTVIGYLQDPELLFMEM